MTDPEAGLAYAAHGRRKYDRLAMARPVEILWRAREYNCRMGNLNPDGALFRCEFPVKIGDVIRVIFSPADLQASLLLVAKVIHVETRISNYFGVLFQRVPIRVKVMLCQYLYRHLPALEFVNLRRVPVLSPGIRYIKESHRWE